MFMRYSSIIIILIALTSCTGPIKVRKIAHHDPIMDQNGGVVLLVDVCNQIDVVGDGDYCVINESKKVASSLVKGIRSYLDQSGVQVRTEIIPFVCGALDTPQNIPIKVAEKVGGTIDEASKPYSVTDEINNDTKYLNALTKLSTYVFERGMMIVLEDYAKVKNKMAEFQKPDLIVQENQFIDAVEVIKTKTNASSLLYVGMKGTKISGVKKIGQGVLSLTVGVATGVATAGLGTGFYVSLIPGRDVDWKYSIAGLINLESKNLTWQHYTSTSGNPLKAKDVANPEEIGRLLKKLVYNEVPVL